ncbi:trimethylamine methyltransferase family protein [Sinisalibacter aestuarii]|uniref:Trimethylamine methyltransferase n=1 Tax=Sinisalibacter aestuarii TaxID=2949426 RepID=A0ABQ5LSN1_9RHOB|nr:trimethylamine methyltransferase family protein [Sinisalibacter aestuarii]GKY87983.1 trimethylamine methyltransferase [Sinisalibacter aestuarii]
MARRPRKDRHADIPPKADAFHLAPAAAPRPRFEIGGEAARAAIFDHALRLLGEHGVAVIHEAAHAALVKAGAHPGSTPERLRFPRELVEEALGETPKTALLAGKRPARDLRLPRRDNGFVMRTGTGAHGFVEIDSRDYRNMEIGDVATIARLANGLDEVGFIAHPFSYGVHELTSDIHGVGELVVNTDKHIWLQPYNVENVEYLVKIVEAAGSTRERPIASMIMCSFTPLEFKVMDVEALIRAGRAGLPVHACSLPSAGGTAPLSVAGNVLMAVTEILAMVTMGHVLAPGLPIIATPLMFTLDMATGQALHACPESLQAKALAVEVLRGLGLMTHTYGMGSDTPAADIQSMAERALLGQAVALAGADVLGGVGQLQTATVFDPVQAVLDDALGGYLRGLIATPPVDEAAFNWDELSRIGIGGHFLSSEQTLALCRSQYRPDIFRRDRRDDYDKAGRRGAWEEARDRARRLIAADLPRGLPDQTARAEIAALRKRADAEIAEKATVSGRRAVV